MKKLNRVGKVKIIFLVVVLLISLVFPFQFNSQDYYTIDYRIVLSAFFMGVLIYYWLLRFSLSPLITNSFHRPKWNYSPLLSTFYFFHYLCFIYLAIGVGITLGSLIKFNELNFISLAFIFHGLGALTGIELVLRTSNKK